MVDLKTKALAVIEHLLGGEETLNKEQTITIYMVAHAALGNCPHDHDDIIRQIEQVFGEHIGSTDGFIN